MTSERLKLAMIHVSNGDVIFCQQRHLTTKTTSGLYLGRYDWQTGSDRPEMSTYQKSDSQLPIGDVKLKSLPVCFHNGLTRELGEIGIKDKKDTNRRLTSGYQLATAAGPLCMQ
jgi:hypothetical protein